MRKVYKLEGELCANCAGKIKVAIEKLDGVNSASVNAMTYKFTLDAEDDKFDAALKQSVKLFADIEPDCEVIL
ncbi:MAG: heavy-metal-associated domain-containing protein [Eggerthellaceae bacterium]|nr:heavy-metal-associated domain-containing protein [Eggerthellaceae bacterium]